MKNILITIFFLAALNAKAQVIVPSWEETFQFEAIADQADGGMVSIDITNQGADIAECNQKARSQALFTIIFKGYAKTNNASASTALTDMSNYNQNLDFYKSYLTSNTAGLAHVTKFQTNTSKPAGKIDKKTLKATTTVYISKTKLREDLQKLGYIKSAAQIAESMGVAPSILIVPSEMWMKVAGYAKTEMTDLGEVTTFDYQNALNDPEMVRYNSIEGYLKPILQKNGFRIVSLSAIMANLSKERATNQARSIKAKESDLDMLARVAQADIWLQVDLVEGHPNNQEIQYKLTLNGRDPILKEDVINGDPITIKTANKSDLLGLIERNANQALDNFIPAVTSYFENRDKVGISGKVQFLISEDLDLTFQDELSIDGETYQFAAVVDAMVSKKSESYKTSGEQTDAERNYLVVIKTKMPNKLSGKVESNNFEKFARLVNSEIKTLLTDQQISAVVEAKGLGGVVVMFIPKPEKK
jgi:hypothetical protein